jgi:hydroxymethylglutaryl-CoA lyase
MNFGQVIFIEEQGLRDGLQTLSTPIPFETKLRWVEQLINAGVKRMQLGSFVHPRLVPMMSDTAELFKYISDKNFKDIIFSALVLNRKGVERAMDAGVKHLSISMSASNTHSLKNTNKSKDEAAIELKEMVALARQFSMSVRGGIQCAFGCRFEGKIERKVVLDLVDYILDLGVDEISLADSTGMANPLEVEEMIYEIKSKVDHQWVGLHLHNTENKGYANLYAGIRAGVNIIDTAFGGLGGCPFISGATGNIATEDTVNCLHQMGIKTGIDIAQIAEISRELSQLLASPLPGYMHQLIKNKEMKFI